MTRRGDNWARGARTRARACQYYRIIARIIHKSSWCQNWVRRIGLRCKKSPKDPPSPSTVCLFGDAVTDKLGAVCEHQEDAEWSRGQLQGLQNDGGPSP